MNLSPSISTIQTSLLQSPSQSLLSSSSPEFFYIKVSCNGQLPVDAFLDTGANINIMTLDYYRTILPSAISNQSPSNHPTILYTITGQAIAVLQVIYLELEVSGITLTPLIPFYVIDHLPHLQTILLGITFVTQHVHEINVERRLILFKQVPTIFVPLVVKASLDWDASNIVTTSNIILISLVRSVRLPPYSVSHVKCKQKGKHIFN